MMRKKQLLGMWLALHGVLEREAVPGNHTCRELYRDIKSMRAMVRRVPNGDELLMVAHDNAPIMEKLFVQS